MTTETQLALNQVFGVIEPLTRFSRNSLLLESENVRVTKGQAFWTFNVVGSPGTELEFAL